MITVAKFVMERGDQSDTNINHEKRKQKKLKKAGYIAGGTILGAAAGILFMCSGISLMNR